MEAPIALATPVENGSNGLLATGISHFARKIMGMEKQPLKNDLNQATDHHDFQGYYEPIVTINLNKTLDVDT